MGAYRITWTMLCVAASATLMTTSQALGDLVAHYDLNEGSGTKVFDSSGSGNDGTIVDAAYTVDSPSTCPAGTALEFSADHQRVEVLDHPSLRPESAVTVEAWVKLGPLAAR